MSEFGAELIGTAILVILGDGVVANAVLRDTKGHQGGWLMITTGWGCAVAIAILCVGRVSGAHINPAVTVSLLTIGQLPAADVPVYLAGQLIGAVSGAVVVWLCYLPHWRRTEDQATKLAVFCTGPAVRSPGANFLTECIGTAMLVFGVLAIGANADELASGTVDLAKAFTTAVNPLLVGLLVWSIGLSLGGPTGYAINPARDLGPRIAHALLPIEGKGGSDWAYAWVPVAGPMVGGIAGALLFQATLLR